MNLSKKWAMAVCLGLASLPAMADPTLTLNTTGGTSVDGVYIYPYNFTVTSDSGATSETSLMCIDFGLHTFQGETWAVNDESISLGNSVTATDYRALALIDYALVTGYGGYSVSDLQFADWSILDPDAVDGLRGYTQGSAAAIASGALAEAADASLTDSGFYSNFTLYAVDTTDKKGWTDGDQPQDFIGYTPTSPTPEPSSLLFTGTGMLGAVETLRRRMKAKQI